MKNQPFVFLSLFLILGIVSQDIFCFGYAFLLFAVFFSTLLCLCFSQKKILYLLLALSVFFFGSLRFYQSNKVDEIPAEYLKNKKQLVQFKIIEEYKPSKAYFKYKAKFLSIDKKNNFSSSYANALIYVDKALPRLYPDDKIGVYDKISKVPSPLNPHQFNYQKHLSLRNIKFQIFTNSIPYLKKGNASWRNKIARSKVQLEESLLEKGYSKDAQGMIAALLLGDRNEMDEALQESYIKTGVVHILSISGLHVAILFGMIYFLLSPLKRITKNRKPQIIISLIIIWLYAYYVNLMPSVSRSALMISIYYSSFLLKRNPNIYHTLALSAFILLLIRPNFLFDIGFQLSYLSVFFIVWLMPIFNSWFPSKNKIVRYARNFIGSSISAQLGTFALVTYYFHQFTGLFLMGNLILIPASSVLIGGGIFSIVLLLLKVDFPYWINAFNLFVELIHSYISKIAQWDNFVWGEVKISLLSVFIFFIVLINFRPFLLKKSKLALMIILLGSTFIQADRLYDSYTKSKKEEFIIFNQYRGSVIGLRKGNRLDVYYSEGLDLEKLKKYLIQAYKIQERITKVNYFDIESNVNQWYTKTKNLIEWKNQRIIMVNHLQNIPKNIDYILIRNSSLPEMKCGDIEKTKKIIVDGSNYPNVISKIDSIINQCSENKLWVTSQQSAYRIAF